VAAWTCPECDRQFGHRNQSHECVPAMSEAEYFASDAGLERQIYDAVLGHLSSVGPLRVEFLTAGIFFKRKSTFAELRPMRSPRVRLSVLLSRVVSSARFVKTWHGPANRHAYFIDLRSAGEVNEEVRDWLTEAYHASPT
jgi:hypothetical protein